MTASVLTLIVIFFHALLELLIVVCHLVGVAVWVLLRHGIASHHVLLQHKGTLSLQLIPFNVFGVAIDLERRN